MAQTEKPAPIRKRVGDYNPDVAVGDLLDPIANKDVTIWSISFDQRTGKKGQYVLAVIEAGEDADNRDAATIYHTGGAVVVERLAAIFGIATVEALVNDYLARGIQPDPGGVLPVTATFTKVRSTVNPAQSYWTVS